jgi:putative transposase
MSAQQQPASGSIADQVFNAATESLFHTLKTEHIFFHRYDTRQDARTSIFEYIGTFHNQHRLHSTLGNLSPMQFELQFTMT